MSVEPMAALEIVRFLASGVNADVKLTQIAGSNLTHRRGPVIPLN